MTKHLKKAPTLIVMGLAGFAAWPILFPEDSPAPARSSTKPPAESKVKLASADGPLARNPFQMILVSSKLVSKEPAVAKKAAPVVKKSDLPTISAEDEAALSGLWLTGTFIEGRQQLAVIDGKVYARGEPLKKGDGSVMPYTITEVRPHLVLLRRGKRNFALKFPEVTRTAGAKPGTTPASTAKADTKQVNPQPPDTIVRARPADGPNLSAARPSSAPEDQRSMLLNLFSRLGGGTSGDSGSPTASASGSGLPSLPSLGNMLPSGIDTSTLSQGIDALMGKFDNIGRGGPIPGDKNP